MLAGGVALMAAPARALPEPPLAGIRRAYLSSRFGQLHARVAEPPRRSSAPPLVLLHQTPLSGRMFERIVPHLARRRRVIAIDTPGYGESDRPAERPPLAGYGDAILAALAGRYGRRYDLLGYHTGAAIAADLAARSAAVRRLVLVSVPLFDEARRTQLLTEFAAPAEPYSTDGSHLLPLWTGTMRVRPAGQTTDDAARLVAEKLRPGRFREWALQSALEADLAEILPSIAQPTLVLAPHDGLQAPSAAAAAMVKRAALIDLPDMAYGLFDAQPRALAERIMNFLDGPDPSPRPS